MEASIASFSLFLWFSPICDAPSTTQQQAVHRLTMACSLWQQQIGYRKDSSEGPAAAFLLLCQTVVPDNKQSINSDDTYHTNQQIDYYRHQYSHKNLDNNRATREAIINTMHAYTRFLLFLHTARVHQCIIHSLPIV